MINVIVNLIWSFIRNSFRKKNYESVTRILTQERLVEIYEHPETASVKEIKVISELLLQLLNAIVQNAQKQVDTPVEVKDQANIH
jgi:galactose-1-phosphate uridylyltransferase